jgi:RNA 3'-terminal phosphate cyclase (ATP)
MTYLPEKMLVIDGSLGEGGGQVLRTAIALSAVTKTAVKVKNIRFKREKPGLQAQHVTCVKAVGELCNAEIKGLSPGSTEVSFSPGDITAGKLSFDVGTAGSATLVLQSLLPPALYSGKQFEFSITGGTDVLWSPPVDYIQHVFLPVIARAGFQVEMTVVKRGYYPKGGGLLQAVVQTNGQPKKFDLRERGTLQAISGVSNASLLLKDRKVAERQNAGARLYLFNELSKRGVDFQPRLVEEYCETFSVGSGITLWADYSNTVLGASMLGEKSKKAEDVGMQAARNLVSEISSNAAVDSHMADQILPYLALFGGEVCVPKLSLHAETNIQIIKQFGFNLNIEEDLIKAEGV